MKTVAQINERLRTTASELASLSESTEPLTEDQEILASELAVEAEELEGELAAAQTSARDAIRQRSSELQARLRQSNRQTAPAAIGRVRDCVADDPQRGFKSVADFALTVYECGQHPQGSERLMRIAAGTGLNRSVSGDGAVLVPPAFSKSIWTGVQQRSQSLLDMCDVIPIDAGVESFTFPAPNETSRADGSRQGGTRGYWKGEESELTSSKPKLRDVKLSPYELYVFSYVSERLLRSAPSAATTMMERGSRDEIAFKIGDAFIEGDGAGKPTGIVGHASTITVAKESNQGAATVVPANIRKMMSRLHTNWRQGAVWLVNPDVIPALEGMEFPVGTGGVPAYLPPGGMSDTPYSRLYGLPVLPLEYCSTLGTEGDIILTNLKAYAVGLKGLVDSSYSMHLKFDFAQTAFRMIFEVDGRPWLDSAITPFKGATSTSTAVTLATRS